MRNRTNGKDFEMAAIRFTKMNGAGNDFLMADNRDGAFPREPALITRLCSRRTGVGSDGLILVEPAQGEGDFRMRFYNPDGSEAEMCGNGARCLARFANRIGAAPKMMKMETIAGIVEAKLGDDGIVDVRLSDPSPMRRKISLELAEGNVRVADWVDTGVPHAVLLVDDLEAVDVQALGRAVRFHEAFTPAGANADFVQLAPDGGGILVRTYERGVEAETLACGTGIAASALSAALAFSLSSPVRVQARSGDLLEVRFTRIADGADGEPRFRDVHLIGPAVFVYDGVVDEGF